MDSFYKITIPEPCNENWSEMTPNEKGRFCDSCSKTVVDFTKLNEYQIQDFIYENRDKKLCGHFKQSQLDSINLFIPHQIVEKQQSYHKLFLLALLIAMGTTLFNCTNKDGQQQKIESVEVVGEDTISYTLGLPEIPKKDTLNANTNQHTSPPHCPPTEILQTGETYLIEGKIETSFNENLVLGFLSVQEPPEFIGTSESLSLNEKRDYFSKKIAEFFQSNFMTYQGHINLEGRQRINTQFIIDSFGKVKNIKVRAPHPILEKEAIKTLQKLPQFVPAKHNGKNVDMTYTLPIIFQVQE